VLLACPTLLLFVLLSVLAMLSSELAASSKLLNSYTSKIFKLLMCLWRHSAQVRAAAGTPGTCLKAEMCHFAEAHGCQPSPLSLQTATWRSTELHDAVSILFRQAHKPSAAIFTMSATGT
jgi:hypothetical protein